MSNSISLPGAWDCDVNAFNQSSGAQWKIISDVSPAQVIADTQNERAPSGEQFPEQVVLKGGKKFIDVLASSTSASDQTLTVSIGKETAVFSELVAVTTVGSTNQIIINHTGDSSLAKRFSIGAGLMLFGNVTAANDGLLGTVTAITSTSITVNMPGVATGTVVQGAGFRIITMGQSTTVRVPASAGNAVGVNPVNVFNYPGSPRSAKQLALGPKNVLVARMATAIAALPDVVSVSANLGLH